MKDWLVRVIGSELFGELNKIVFGLCVIHLAYVQPLFAAGLLGVCWLFSTWLSVSVVRAMRKKFGLKWAVCAPVLLRGMWPFYIGRVIDRGGYWQLGRELREADPGRLTESAGDFGPGPIG